MNSMEDRLKIKKLWHSLLPGDIICDSTTSGEEFSATVVSKKQEGSYCVSVFSSNPRIKPVALGIFKWHHKTNLVISEKNVPVPFFNEPFGIKKAKDLRSQKDPSELIAGGYQMTKEEFKEILNKVGRFYAEIKKKLEEEPLSSFFPLTNFIMNTIFGPGNYTKKEYVLISLIIHYYEKKFEDLTIDKLKMETDKEEALKEIERIKTELLKTQNLNKPKLPPPM